MPLEEKLEMGYVRRDGAVYNSAGNRVEYEEFRFDGNAFSESATYRRIDFNIFDDKWNLVGWFNPMIHDLPEFDYLDDDGLGEPDDASRYSPAEQSVMVAKVTITGEPIVTKRVPCIDQFRHPGRIRLEYSHDTKKSVLFRPYAKVSGCSRDNYWGCCERWEGEDSESTVRQCDLHILCTEVIIKPQMIFSNNGYVWATSEGRRTMRKDRYFFSLVNSIGREYFWRFAQKTPHWKKEGCEFQKNL